jgi:hypothetical protein
VIGGNATPSFTVTTACRSYAELLRRIELRNVKVFINRLRLHVIFGTDPGRDLFPSRARDHDTDELFAAAFDLFVQFDLRRVAPFKMERSKRRTRDLGTLVNSCCKRKGICASKSRHTSISRGESSSVKRGSCRPGHRTAASRCRWRS